MGINTKQLIELIIQPALKEIGLYSLEAEILLAGTCAQESHMGTYIAQVPLGIAKGIYQMENETHDDIWKNYIPNNPKLEELLPGVGFAEDMIHDLRYATIMCRIHYLRVKQPVPYPQLTDSNIANFAAYWKKYYNTPLGAGKEEDFIKNFNMYVMPYYQGK